MYSGFCKTKSLVLETICTTDSVATQPIKQLCFINECLHTICGGIIDRLTNEINSSRLSILNYMI